MSNRILSYRGLIADLTQETILLSTNKGEVGYRIIKFQLMTNNPGADQDVEHVLKIYKESQGTPNSVVDFSDNRLLGAGTYKQDTAHEYPIDQVVIFDQEIFNQDIYITHKDNLVGAKCNYYLELEVIKLDESQAMVATLKDIRNNS